MRFDGQIDLTSAQISGNSDSIANFRPGIVGQLVFYFNSLQSEVKMFIDSTSIGYA
jgi:hypothetical protein